MARRSPPNSKTRTLTAEVPLETYKKWRDLCNRGGFKSMHRLRMAVEDTIRAEELARERGVKVSYLMEGRASL